jgi:hypothetical protein
LQRFTPNVSILLTKVDTLDVAGEQEVRTFVEDQLKSKFPGGLSVFPFSIRPGYKGLRERFEREYVANALASFQERRAAALERKLQTLLQAIGDYLQLAMDSADERENDREDLRSQILGSEDFLADQKLQFQLLAKHAAARTRSLIQERLQKTVLTQLQRKLAGRLASEFSGWRGSFAQTLSQFESWLQGELESELSNISSAEAGDFLESLRDFQRQCHENLQAFRKQLSERVLSTFGFPFERPNWKLRFYLRALRTSPSAKFSTATGNCFQRSFPCVLFEGLSEGDSWTKLTVKFLRTFPGSRRSGKR